jgi:hypothetical protein
MNRIAVAQELVKLAKELTARKQKYRDYTIEKSGDNFYVRDPSGHRAFGEVPATIETAKKWIDLDIHEKRKKSASSESMNRKLAKELTAKDERELRVMTMEDVMNDTPLLRLKVVFKGTMDEVNDHAKKKGLVWKDSRKEIFGGYWYDKNNGEAYPIT